MAFDPTKYVFTPRKKSKIEQVLDLHNYFRDSTYNVPGIGVIQTMSPKTATDMASRLVRAGIISSNPNESIKEWFIRIGWIDRENNILPIENENRKEMNDDSLRQYVWRQND